MATKKAPAPTPAPALSKKKPPNGSEKTNPTTQSHVETASGKTTNEKQKSKRSQLPDVAPPTFGNVELALIQGDLSKLTEVERVNYYMQVCHSVGLNHLTKPFMYFTDTKSGKVSLYALKACTDQLRQIHKVSVVGSETKFIPVNTDNTAMKGATLMQVIVTVQTPDGRRDMDMGGVYCNPAKMDAETLSNAIKKSITQAKRRATLSICGLSILDETELDDVPQFKPMKEMLAIETKAVPDAPKEQTTEAADADAESAENGDPDTPAEDLPHVEGTPQVVMANAAQLAKYNVFLRELEKSRGADKFNRDIAKAHLKKEFGVESSKELTEPQMGNVLTRLEAAITADKEKSKAAK